MRRGRPPSASASAGAGAAAGASGMNVGTSRRPTLLSTAPRLVGLFAAQPRTEAGEPGPLRRQEVRPRNGEPGLGSPPKGGNTPRRAGVLSRPDAEEEPAVGAGRVARARPSTGLAAAQAGKILVEASAGTSWDIEIWPRSSARTAGKPSVLQSLEPIPRASGGNRRPEALPAHGA